MRHTLAFEHTLTPAGLIPDLRLQISADGTIAAVESAGGGPYDGWLALPGMPNAHSHAFQRALAGQGEVPVGEDSFWSWRDAMYRLAGRIDPEQCYAVARQAYAEMLCAGFTSVAEFHYLHHAVGGAPGPEMTDAVVRAAGDAGIRLGLVPVHYQSSGFSPAGGLPPTTRQQRFVHASVDDFAAACAHYKGAMAGIAAHSLRAVPPELLIQLRAGADELLGPDAPLHIHISEQPREVAECIATHGLSPIALLHERVGLGPRWQLVHATFATEKERALIRDTNANVVLCPLTEGYLADGIFPAQQHWRAGGSFAIGSDSNVRIDAIEELRLLEYGQRLLSGQRARIAGENGTGATLWQAAVQGGARALGPSRPGRVNAGEVAAGAAADLLVLEPGSGALAGVHPQRALDAWLTSGDGRCVADVYVGGRRVVERGVHHDAGRIRAEFVRAMGALWS